MDAYAFKNVPYSKYDKVSFCIKNWGICIIFILRLPVITSNLIIRLLFMDEQKELELAVNAFNATITEG